MHKITAQIKLLLLHLLPQSTTFHWKYVEKGSTFVRWGRKTCPAKTTLVYSGVAGGKQYNQAGSGTNRLCLTRSPQFNNTPVPAGGRYGYLYGAEYQYIRNYHDHDVPCSVCRAPQSTTIMMAATLTCPPGWTAQYTGYLTAALVCVCGDWTAVWTGLHQNGTIDVVTVTASSEWVH